MKENLLITLAEILGVILIILLGIMIKLKRKNMKTKNKVFRKGYSIQYSSSKDNIVSLNTFKVKNKYYWRIRTISFIVLFEKLQIPYSIKFGVSQKFLKAFKMEEEKIFTLRQLQNSINRIRVFALMLFIAFFLIGFYIGVGVGFDNGVDAFVKYLIKINGLS